MLFKTFFPPDYLYDDEQIQHEIKKIKESKICNIVMRIFKIFQC